MIADMPQYARPIQFSSGRINDVSYVCSVEALAPRYKQFRHQKFLWRQQAHRNPQHATGMRMLDPRRIDRNYGITHSGDETKKMFVAMPLRQPYRIGDLAIESILHQTSERSRCVLRS